MKHKITDWSITATVERPDGTWYDHTITDFPEHIGITVNEWLDKCPIKYTTGRHPTSFIEVINFDFNDYDSEDNEE